jgi:hypothetical protein
MLHKRGYGIYEGLGEDRRQEVVPYVWGSKMPKIGYIIKMFRNKNKWTEEFVRSKCLTMNENIAYWK